MTRSGWRRGRALPWGLIGMLGLVWIGEGLLVRTGRTHQIGVSWRLARRAAGRDAARCELLVFGDSQAKFGLLPRVLEERLGTPAFNLAVLRGQARSSLALLDRALRAGARPKVVLINGSPWLLGEGARLNAALWPELLGPIELIDLARAARDPMVCLRALRRWLVPVLDDREEIRALIAARLAGEPVRGALERAEAAAPDRGAEVVAPGRPRPCPAAPTAPDPRCWRPAPEHLADLGRFLDRAARAGARTVLLIPPMRPDMQAACERAGLDAAYSPFVRRLQERSPGLSVIDGRPLGLGADQFADAAHLNARGAERFTREVAEALRNSTPCPLAVEGRGKGASRRVPAIPLTLTLPRPEGADRTEPGAAMARHSRDPIER